MSTRWTSSSVEKSKANNFGEHTASSLIFPLSTTHRRLHPSCCLRIHNDDSILIKRRSCLATAEKKQRRGGGIDGHGVKLGDCVLQSRGKMENRTFFRRIYWHTRKKRDKPIVPMKVRCVRNIVGPCDRARSHDPSPICRIETIPQTYIRQIRKNPSINRRELTAILCTWIMLSQSLVFAHDQFGYGLSKGPPPVPGRLVIVIKLASTSSFLKAVTKILPSYIIIVINVFIDPPRSKPTGSVQFVIPGATSTSTGRLSLKL